MKIARAEKTDMFKNKGIPAQKTKTQKQKRTKGSGRSKNLPLRHNLPATPEDLINLTPSMSAGNQMGLRPPFPPLHSFMALPVLPDVSEEGAPTRFAGSNLLSLERSSNMFEGDMITNSSELVTPDKDNLTDHLQPGLYDEASLTEDGTETSQLPPETAALFCELDRELKYLISTCTAIIDLPKQNGLKTQLNQSEHTPLSTPAVPKEKTLAQIEMQLAGSEKTEMFRNEGIASRKRKTQYLPKNKPEGIPSRKRKTQYLPKNKPDPGLSEFSFEAPLPENAEKTATIAAPNATAGARSSSSEASLIGMHSNNSHEDGDETLTGHKRRKRVASSSAEDSEGSGLKKAKDVEDLPMPVPLPTDQAERQGICMGSDPGVGQPTCLRIPGLVLKSASEMGSGPDTQRPIDVTQIQTPGETMMALEWPLQQQVSSQQLLQQQLPVASEERASHLLLMAEGDKTLVENALATLESPAGWEEPVTPSADQFSQTLAGQDRPTGLGEPSQAYQAATGLNADIGFTQNSMSRDELVAAAERFAKGTFEAAMKASREEADKVRKERDDAQAAASEERRLREGLATEKVALEKFLLAKSKEAQGLEQELQGMIEKHTQLRSELEALSAEHGRLKDAALSACDFTLSGSSTREMSTSVIIEGLKNLPDRLATVIKDRAFNAVRDALAVARSRYDSTDLTKIGKGLAVAGGPHRPELEEIAKR